MVGEGFAEERRLRTEGAEGRALISTIASRVRPLAVGFQDQATGTAIP
jgi:hypothetical protein